MGGKNVILQCCLVSLAAIVVLTGLYTQSWRKMVVTYLFGMLAIGGVLLPDWKFFDRPLSQWCTLVAMDDDRDGPSRSTPPRFKLYSLRIVIYSAVYGFAFHKWWKFILSS